MIRLLLADDHVVLREDTAAQLNSGEIVKVIAQSETSDETLKIAQQLLPDMVLLDTHMPGLLSTLELVKRLTALRRVKVIMFGSEGKAAEVQDLLEAGAAGYILKTDAVALMRMSILMVSRGAKGIVSPSLPRHLTSLSDIERAALHQLTQKGKLPQMAERMSMSEEDFVQLLDSLASKLELGDKVQLVKWAKKQGF